MPTQNEWRAKIKKKLKGHTFFDPDEFENTFSDATIVNYDKSIIKKSDLVIANITRLSAGTSMEIMFAFDNHIPVVLTGDMSLIGPWHRHHSSFVCKDMEEVIKAVQKYHKQVFEKRK